MEQVFLELLNMSITASWLVLAIIIFRWIFKKAPKSLCVILWALVGIRLICPFSVESILSLIPSTETVPQNIMYMQNPEINSGIHALNSTINPVISDVFAPNPATSANPLQIVVYIASHIWVLGMIVMVLYTTISYICLKRKVREAVPIRDKVWMCDRIETPFILGVIRPNIYLPSSMSEEDVTYVLAHEKAHIKRHDHWWKPLGFALLTVYWFNPIIWIAYVLLCRDIELACDEKVLNEMGTEIKRAYSMALINCSVPRKMIAACPLAFGEIGVKERVKTVLNYKKPAFWVMIIAVVASVIVTVCFLTNPIETNEDEKPKHTVSVSSSVYANVDLSENVLSAEDAQVVVNILEIANWEDDYNNRVMGTFYFVVDGVNLIYSDTEGMFYNEEELQSVYINEADRLLVNQIVYKYLYSSFTDSKATEWFDFLTDFEGVDETMVYEHADLQGMKFEYYLGGITIYNGNTVIREISPCINAFFCDLTQDGIPELCMTWCFGSGLIDERVVVYDSVQDVFYKLEERGYYDYVLSLLDETLIVTKVKYSTDEIVAQGPIVLEENSESGELYLKILSENSNEVIYELSSGIYLAGVEKDTYPPTASTGEWPYIYIDASTKDFRIGQSLLMSYAIFGTYEFDGTKLTLFVGDNHQGDKYVLYINEYGNFEYNEDESDVSEHQWLKEGMVFGLMPE